ncbi:MAG: sulfite exporter TauE/SafE family protein [Cyclobacteriaceae bacterium]
MIGALAIGLLGGLHCVGMCGPLMITFTSEKAGKQLLSFSIYHFGRLMVYAVIGVLFGLLSHSLLFFEVQQLGSVVLGLGIITLYAVPGFRRSVEGWYERSPFYQRVKTNLIGGYHTKGKWFFAGMLNGFLPCGMIYLAAAGAIMAGSVGSSILYMLSFGLGTIPFLMVLFFVSKRVTYKRFNFTKMITPVAIISGTLLVFRGLMATDPDIDELTRAQIANMVTACGF